MRKLEITFDRARRPAIGDNPGAELAAVVDLRAAMTKGPAVSSIDAALLAIEAACPGRIVRDRDVLETYCRDESEAKPVVPEAVVRAQNSAQVKAVMRAASEHRIPVTARAGGTGRVGGAVPTPGSIVLSFEGMNRIKGIEKDDLRVIVEPGVVLADLHNAVEAEGLFYAPDPNSLQSCRLGGNLACNAGGPRAFKYGVTRNWVLGLDAITAGGEHLRLGKPTAKGVTGYDLAGLVVGSEGTLAMITEATLRLVPKPQAVATLLVFLPDQQSLSNAIGETLRQGVVPRCLEFLDDLALAILKPQAGLPVPDGAGAMLLVELDGDESHLASQVERCGNAMMEAGALDVLLAKNEAERERLWGARREMSRAMRKQAKNKLSEDVVVPRTKLGDLLSLCRNLAEEHNIRMPSYGHAGDGNLHVNLLWDEPDQRPRVDAAIEGLFRGVVALGGTMSGEHGIGLLKAPYLGIEQSPGLIALQENIKKVFDPQNILNPDKLFPGAHRRFHGAC